MKNKLISFFIGGFTVVVASLLATPTSAWGPERTTYTNESPAPYATFNSITDNVAVGDERNFVRVKEVGTDTPHLDEVEVTPGKEYEVYIYYHNNAATSTNSAGYGMATGVKVSSAYPVTLTAGERGMLSGLISWSYVTPDSPNDPQEATVWDEAYFTTNTDGVKLRYKTGTAIIHNGGQANGSVLSTDLFTKGGTYIGYNKLTGKLPGCAEYSGYITYTLVAENTDVSLEKHVSLDGENWSDTLEAKPGDYVTYKVAFKNTGNTNLTNVIFKDALADGLKLRSGSTKVFSSAHPDGETISDIINLSGYNTGDADPGSLVQVIYQAKVPTDTSYCGKTLVNTIVATYNGDQSSSDDASVTVACEPAEKTCKTNPEMEGCKELPTTGPLEIVMATVVILSIGAGGYYLYRTRKTLKTVETTATGKADKKADKADKPDKETDSSQKS